MEIEAQAKGTVRLTLPEGVRVWSCMLLDNALEITITATAVTEANARGKIMETRGLLVRDLRLPGVGE